MDTFAFDDTGPPPGTNGYTTLLVVHGTGFHKGEVIEGFERTIHVEVNRNIQASASARTWPGHAHRPHKSKGLLRL